MDIIILLIGISILILGIPAGFILRRLTIEEIKSGRIYFNVLWLSSIILAIIFLFIPIEDKEYKYTLIFGLLFIAIISFISWTKPLGKKLIIKKEKK